LQQRRAEAAERDGESGDPDDVTLPEIDLTSGKKGKSAAEAILDALAMPAGSAMHAVLKLKRLPRNIGAKADMAKFVMSQLLARDGVAVAEDERGAKVYLVDPKQAAAVLQRRMAEKKP
jgi:hypothetical protein